MEINKINKLIEYIIESGYMRTSFAIASTKNKVAVRVKQRDGFHLYSTDIKYLSNSEEDVLKKYLVESEKTIRELNNNTYDIIDIVKVVKYIS